MSQIVAVSDPLFQRISQWAEATRQPVEQVIGATLERWVPEIPSDLPTECKTALSELMQMSDAELRVAATEKAPQLEQNELSQLLELNRHGELDESQERRLDELVDLGELFTLRISWARMLLKERGVELEG